VIIAEPAPTRFDIRFDLGKIPVTIHPLFWLTTVLLGIGTGRGVEGVVLWTSAVLVSILVHELGHALVARAHGWPPRILLWGLGGLAIYAPTRETTRSRILIALAGPGAGFVFGAIVLVAIVVAGYSAPIPLPLIELAVGTGPSFVGGGGRLELFVLFLLWFNLFWGVMNLTPVIPLDGGTVCQAVVGRLRPRDGLRLSVQISLGFAALVAAVAIVWWRSPFIAILFGMLGYQSWAMLRQLDAVRR
jgi:membrane-associated protease RseP (regulator of RpoE activity)